ncbi:MAG: hypothetical protein EBS06_01375 [Proteobacteria bacterium]|nr:hypothetical protein [Pseudomonadota bacterium]
MKKIFALLFAALFLQITNANCAISDWKENESKGAKTRLLTSFYQNENGEKKLIAAIEFKIKDGWKIYGQGSDGIGLPPSFDLSESKNYLKHEIIWPKAEEQEEKIGNEVFKYSAYHGDVILPINIDLKDNSKESELVLKLNYGLCKEVCIPVNESFTAKIIDEVDPEALSLIQKFYPEKISSTLVESASDQKPPMSSSIFYWSLIAIIGGAILNIMPCVLPVLSIKLLSIINHLDTKISRIRFAFFATICGIISCFFIFAVCAALIKFVGNSFGWGLQFQNPYFLIFLIVVLTLFTANLLGIFEITFDQLALNFLNKKITDSEGKKNIFIPNFLSGILAVLLATPCSAPILGSAISFALTQNMFAVFFIFCSIGIGFSLPYIFLIIAPKLVYLLPKPGNWMLGIKKLMAALLVITVFWLAYVLSHNIGFIPALGVVILALLLLLCFELKLKFIKFLAFALVLSATFAMPRQILKTVEIPEEIPASICIKFDEKLIHQLVMEGKVVVVDVTADWCITCKINKLTVLNSKEIIEKLNDPNIVTMRADITKPNEEAMMFLRKFNRFAIPFNAVYGPNAKKGLPTSELLSKKELLELIEKAK